MYKELIQAAAGKIYASIMSKKYKADRYVFFPDCNKAYLKYGVKLLPQYMQHNKFDQIIVIAADSSVQKEIVKQGITNIRFQKISTYRMHCLLNYYALKDMSDKWTVVSTKMPYDTGAGRLLGIKGVTCRDIIYYDIYKLDGEMA